MPSTQKQQATSNPSSEVTLASVRTSNPRIPPEVVYYILAQVIGTYFADVVLRTRRNGRVRTLPTLLFVTRAVRQDAIALLQKLLGRPFEGGSLPSDYGQIVSSLRDLSEVAYAWAQPRSVREFRLFSILPRLLRLSIYPFVTESTGFLLSMCSLEFWGRTRLSAPQQELIFNPNLESLLDHHRSIPQDLRPMLLGDLWKEFLPRVIQWHRLRTLDQVMTKLASVLTEAVLLQLASTNSSYRLGVLNRLREIQPEIDQVLAAHQAKLTALSDLGWDVVRFLDRVPVNYGDYLLFIHQVRQVGFIPEPYCSDIRDATVACFDTFFEGP